MVSTAIVQCADRHKPKLTRQNVLITCVKHPSVQIGNKPKNILMNNEQNRTDNMIITCIWYHIPCHITVSNNSYAYYYT